MNARCVVLAATPTATSTSAAARHCERCPIARARRSSTASSKSSIGCKPLHVSLVGGEPLVRYRELDVLLPQLSQRGLYVQVVTSAVRPIPDRVGVDPAAADLRVDRRAAAGARRAPDAGHLRSHPQAHRGPPDHRPLHGDAAADPARRLHRGIRAHVVGQRNVRVDLAEPLHAASRRGVRREAPARRSRARRRDAAAVARRASRSCRCRGRCSMPIWSRPTHPSECIFAQTTECVSADLQTRITPCQFGGTPDCSNCGCMASAGLAAVGRHRLGGVRADRRAVCRIARASAARSPRRDRARPARCSQMFSSPSRS